MLAQERGPGVALDVIWLGVVTSQFLPSAIPSSIPRSVPRSIKLDRDLLSKVCMQAAMSHHHKHTCAGFPYDFPSPLSRAGSHCHGRMDDAWARIPRRD